MSYGVTSTGFVLKTLANIKDEIEQEQWDTISPALDMSADAPVGQLNGVVVGKLAEIWEVMLAVYRAFDPDNAIGDAQGNICAITGTVRESAEASTVDVYCTGTPATALPSGRVITNDAGDRFATTALNTIAAGVAWVHNTAYVVGDIVENQARVGGDNIYYCSQAGTSENDNSKGPNTTGDDIVDGTCKWDFVGDGTGYIVAEFTAEETGAITCNTGSVDTEDSLGAIETPVAGWEDARNFEDATLGQAIETDVALRLRREDELRATGTGTLESMKADMLDVDGVTATMGFENTTDAVDGDGLPAHSIEIIVLGGTDLDVAEQIWATKPGGIETYGSTSQVITDSQGDSHTMKFSRPTEKRIYAKLTYLTDDDYPANGDTLVENAVAAWGNALGNGEDVVTSQMYEVIFEATSGIVDITEILISIHPVDPPVASANLSIGNRELSTWDTGDIDLVVT